MENEPTNKSQADNLLLSALKELKEMKFEVTVNIRPAGALYSDPFKTDVEASADRMNITRSEELLPPVLTPKHIKEFLGISQAKVYEFLNSGQVHVARAGRTLYVSRAVFLEWFEGKGDDQEVKRRS